METFTPVTAALGGALIGLSAALLLLLNGRVAGISGIVGGLLGPPDRGDVGWRVAFVLGLFAAGAVAMLWSPASLASDVPTSASVIVAAGLLVGIGTRVGNGCTSGHGVCGLSRLSRRSAVATTAFMATAVLTVFLTRHVIGGVL